MLPDLPDLPVFHDLGTGHGGWWQPVASAPVGIPGDPLPWSAASEHRSCAKIDSLHHPHKLPLVEETLVVSIENAQQEADLLFLGNDLWKGRSGIAPNRRSIDPLAKSHTSKWAPGDSSNPTGGLWWIYLSSWIGL